ncbi:hypothetical protein ACFQXB_04660 [Plastorhodobacter daqingensis]|uniref:Uncharacterized protein n=1 Tax=Plastorhodobacter daqingensis TaxID=1387281 RepID=A0ABW2UFM0_9RHOB
MTDLAELEGRITMALDRIALGLEALPSVPASSGSAEQDLPVLQQALEAERDESNRLAREIEDLRHHLAQQDGASEERARLAAQLEVHGREIQRLRRANGHVRQVIGRLRAALEARVSDPQLVNEAMAAELEALQAARSVDLAEIDEILAELDPLVEGGPARG